MTTDYVDAGDHAQVTPIGGPGPPLRPGHNTVSRIWRTFGLQSHCAEVFKLSSDPFFIEKVRDVMGLYLHLPDRASDPHVRVAHAPG